MLQPTQNETKTKTTLFNGIKNPGNIHKKQVNDVLMIKFPQKLQTFSHCTEIFYFAV